MNVTILGASGATGTQLMHQALDRGHRVTAIARTPSRITAPDSDRLTRLAADVLDTPAITAALNGSTTILSGLGVAAKEKPGVLVAGARAAEASGASRIIWIGALGTGDSAQATGKLTAKLLSTLLKTELPDKIDSDHTVVAAGGTVFHCGPLTNKTLSPSRRTVTLAQTPHRFFPARVSRATVAAAMLDEAETGTHPGMILVPLDK
jgi:hypothetical protein